MKRSKYNTESKKIVLEKIKVINCDFTAKILKVELGDSVGLTTIYRILNDLAENGILKKYYNKKNTAHFQYLNKCDKKNHFYLKCIKCGRVQHVDCDCIKEINDHIFKEHSFDISADSIFIKGICKKCK